MDNGVRKEILKMIERARGKSARSAAWTWAEWAVAAAQEAGLDVQIEVLGNDSYPELDILERLVRAAPEYVIVTRHKGLVEWLARHGITGETIDHVSDPAQIRGRRVVGNLPLHLAAEATSITTVDMPDLPADKRGQDLTPEEMDSFGATLARYAVVRL